MQLLGVSGFRSWQLASSEEIQTTGNRGSSVVSKVFKVLNEVRKDEDGAAMAEYVVLLGIIAAAMVTLMVNFSTVLQGKFTAVCTALNGTC